MQDRRGPDIPGGGSSGLTGVGTEASFAFIRKLEHGAELSDFDRKALADAVSDVRQIGARQDVITEGDRPEHVHVVVEGLACRYKLLADGQRQILAYLVPGDMCDLHVAILGEMDHAIGTLAPCKIAYIGAVAIQDLTTNHPAVNRALWWATLVDEAILREWIVSAGRRPADKRMAHLFCELFMRLETVGLAQDSGFELPITQDELGDTLGISTVHANRVLQQLRDDALVSFKGKRLTIHDFRGLQDLASFEPNYLHLKKRSGKGAEPEAEPSAQLYPRPERDGLNRHGV